MDFKLHICNIDIHSHYVFKTGSKNKYIKLFIMVIDGK